MKRIWMILAALCLFMHISAQNTVKEKDPGLAWFMSLVIPGSGQFYNGQYVKGGIMMGIWAGSATGMIINLHKANRHDEYAGCHHEETGKALQWFCLLLLDDLWSMIDAPISANLINKRNRLSIKPDLSMTTHTPVGYPMQTPAIGATLSLTF